MSNPSSFATLLGLTFPIVQGPFGGGLSTVRLTATVSNGGGLGSFGAHQLTGEQIETTVRELRAATTRPFAINLWIPKHDERSDAPAVPDLGKARERYAELFQELGLPLPEPAPPPLVDFEEQVEAVLATRPAVFSFVFGIPAPHILQACRARGIVTLGAATTPDEAQALEQAGVDAIVASGSDAGGHRPSFLHSAESSLVGTMALVPQVVDAVDRPVIAAGGIADARGVAAARALGAQGVQVGTAFLACEESGVDASHRQVLFSPRARRTLLSRGFTGRLARYVRTRYLEKFEQGELHPLGYPMQGAYSRPIARSAAQRADADFMPLYAGQAAPLLKHTRARELLDALAAAAA